MAKPAPVFQHVIHGERYDVTSTAPGVYEISHGAETWQFDFFPDTSIGPAAFANLPGAPRAVANAFVAEYRRQKGI